MNTETTAKAPTFEEVIVDALSDHTISSNALADLVEEVKTAVTTATNDAAIAKAVALDPLQSPDADTARATMEAARFKADRLKSLLPRLQERLIETGNQEDYAAWRKKFDPLKSKVEAAAAKLAAVYAKSASDLVVLFSEIEKIDAEVLQVSLAKPHYVRAASNDGCHLRGVELTARGLDAFSVYAHEIMKMKLPDLNNQDKLLWSPDRHIDYSHVIPVSPKQHPGADWWKSQAQDHAEAAAKAEQANAEHQQAEGAKRETYHRPSDSVTY